MTEKIMHKTPLSYGRKALISFREKIKKSSGGHGLNSFSIIYENGEQVYFMSRACYAALMSLDYHRHHGHPAILISTIKESFQGYPRESKKLAIRYLNWLINYSPYRFVFHTKSGKEAFELGVVCKTKIPSNLIVGGLIAVREVTDIPSKIATWYKLIKLGVPSSFAYYMSYLLYYRSEENTFELTNVSEWHRSLDVNSISKKSIKNFLLGNIEINNKDFLYDNVDYTNPDRFWHEPKDYSYFFPYIKRKIYTEKDFPDLVNQLTFIEKEILNA